MRRLSLKLQSGGHRGVVPEGFALEEYKSERILKAQVRRLPGSDTRYELDGFLKTYRVRANVTVEDVRRDLQNCATVTRRV